jgi:hypothetical protein
MVAAPFPPSIAVSSPRPATLTPLSQIDSPPQVEALVAQLGQQTRVNPANGIVALNQPLMEQLTALGPLALPALTRTLATNQDPLTLHETLLTLEQLKRRGVAGVDHCYGVASQLQGNPNPLVQIGLAHLYASLDITCPLGPSVVGLMQSVNPTTTAALPFPSWSPAEAWGHAVGEQLAKQSARATVKALLPVWQANGIAVPPETSAWLGQDTYMGQSTQLPTSSGPVWA